MIIESSNKQTQHKIIVNHESYLAMLSKGGSRVRAALLESTTVREQHPRSHHKGRAISMQTHPAVRVGFVLAAASSSKSFDTQVRLRHTSVKL